MTTIEQLLHAAGFEPERASTAKHQRYHKPGTAFRATVGARHLRLLRVDGPRVEDIRLLASVERDDIDAVAAALNVTKTLQAA
jgi:hypothetical protein